MALFSNTRKSSPEPGKPSKAPYEFVHYLRTPLIVVVVSTFLLLLTRWIYQFRHVNGTWNGFWNEWGAGVGVVFTILLGALVVLFPSRLEKKLDEQTEEIGSQLNMLSERIRSQLRDFPEIFKKATELLEGLKNGPQTVFKIISASPVLGLEFDNDETEKWRSLLASRIEAGRETEIVCLDPRSLGGRRSPLGNFCKTLGEKYLRQIEQREGKSEKRTVDGNADPMRNFRQLYDLGRTQIESFQAKYSKQPMFKLKWSSDPPFQIVIARNELGDSRSILYFATTSTLERGLPVSGFYTEDARMGELLDSVFQYVSAAAVDAAADQRTSLQRDRDFELQCFCEEKTLAYDLDLTFPGTGSKLDKFKLFVDQGVFPPEIALAKNAFFEAIAKAAMEVWEKPGIKIEQRLGIDVGTGTGVLALFLASYSRLIWLTDIGDKELNNAKINFKRYQEKFGPDVTFKEMKRYLLEGLPDLHGSSVPLFVFNHPYYPSPSNVFNVGGSDAGLKLIVPFLEQAKAYLKGGGGVVMPYAEIAREHDPLKVAIGLGYRAEELNRHSDPKYGEHKIFLFRI